MEYEQLIKRYVCRFCKGSFDQAENLYKHVQQIHTVRSSTKEHRTCLICGVQCQKNEDYRNHIRHIHGLPEEGQVFSFKCFNDFLLWKNETEKRNYCKFVMRSVPKVLPSNDKVHRYQCDSSGSKTKEKKGFVAVKDSCPAMISAVESAKTRGIKVEYWNNHIGHPVPIEDDELDAAINSLQAPEIVIGDDQRFQSDSASNIYENAESNDASLSEDIVINEASKSKKSLFMKNSNQSTVVHSKSEMQRFSFKKDPSKKMPSFQYSLASVACMKPKPKPPKIEENLASITATIENDNPDSNSVPPSSPFVEPTAEISEPEESAASNENPLEANASTTTTMKVSTPKEPEKEPATTTPNVKSGPAATTTPNAKSISATTQSNVPNLNLISDGIASGQYVILNSVPGENGVQNLLLCPVSTSATSSKPTSSTIINPSEHSEDSSIIFISSTGEVLAEKENTSSVQNVLTFKTNTPLPQGVEKSFLPSGKSLLKTPKSKKVVSKKSPGLIIEKTLTTGKHQSPQSFLMKDIKPMSGLATTNKPVTFTPILVSSFDSIQAATFVSATSSIPCMPAVVSSASVTASKTTSKPPGSTLNKAAIISSPVPALKNPAFNPSTKVQNVLRFGLPQDVSTIPQYVNNNLSGPIVGQTVLPSGQTSFMTFNNNLIPIGKNAATFMSNTLNSSYVIPTASPVVRNQRPSLTSVPVSQPVPNQGVSTAVSQILSSIGKTLPPNAVPIIILPNSENLTPIPSASSGTNVNPLVSNALRPVTNSVASKPIIMSSVQPTAPPLSLIPHTGYASSVLPGGAQLIPVSSTALPSSNVRPSLLPQAQTLLKTVPMTTSFPKSIISTTISNALQVQRVRAPAPSNVVSRPNVGITTTPRFQTNRLMSPLVLNTEPISSTPAINIPSVPSAKPGTLFLKSPEGGVYMLEPVEESSLENSSPVSVTPNSNLDKSTEKDTVKTTQGKMNIPLIDIGSKNKIPDKEVKGISSCIKEDKANIPVINLDADDSENVFDFDRKINDPCQSHLDTKLERKLKTPSPRKTPEFRNGVQIKSVVQEKRPFKEDDVEILKKVKYYQMEMKYLSSQAECKKLKLELAMAKQKNEALMNKEDIPNDEPKEIAAVEETSNDKEEDRTLDSAFGMDISYTDEDTVTDNDDEKTIVGRVLETIVAKVTRDIEFDDEQSMDIEFSEITGGEAIHSINDEIMHAFNEVEEVSSNSKGFESEIQTDLDTNREEALLTPESSHSLEISELAQQVVDANNPEEEAMLENILEEPPVVDLHPGEEAMSPESLKSLEHQYGKQSSLNIYTMIRTSVLRNLYEDTKGLCEENKKLFEELQNYRAQGQLYEILDEEL